MGPGAPPGSRRKVQEGGVGSEREGRQEQSAERRGPYLAGAGHVTGGLCHGRRSRSPGAPRLPRQGCSKPARRLLNRDRGKGRSCHHFRRPLIRTSASHPAGPASRHVGCGVVRDCFWARSGVSSLLGLQSSCGLYVSLQSSWPVPAAPSRPRPPASAFAISTACCTHRPPVRPPEHTA